MGFGQGLSGLRAQSQKLDVIGNNIANSGTVGFKSSTVSFADVYATSRVGLGTSVAAVNQNFGVGVISSTGGQFDMAIDGGSGMFRVIDSNGNVLYTRNGEFHADKDGWIVNAQGYRLTGYPVGSTAPQPIRVPSGNIAPQATTRIESVVNVNANVEPIAAGGGNTPEVPGVLEEDATGTLYYFRVDGAGAYEWVNADGTAGGAVPADGVFTSPTGTVTFAGGQPADQADFDAAINTAYAPEVPGTTGVAFDPLNPDTWHHKLPLTVYDALGNPHQIEQYFIKRPGANPVNDPPTWEVQYITTTRALDGTQLAVTPSSAVIDFNSRGEFVGTNPPAPLTLTLALTETDPPLTVAPTEALVIQIDYAGSTQFGAEFSYRPTQNGYSSGEYSSMSIGTNGEIIASYTNGQPQNMGSLVLANFNNLQGLQPVGGNAWRETSASGQPILGEPGTNGMSLIKGQSLEESNVDMGTELVNMIITQRAYQANAQTITTQSEILQTLLNIR